MANELRIGEVARQISAISGVTTGAIARHLTTLPEFQSGPQPQWVQCSERMPDNERMVSTLRRNQYLGTSALDQMPFGEVYSEMSGLPIPPGLPKWFESRCDDVSDQDERKGEERAADFIRAAVYAQFWRDEAERLCWREDQQCGHGLFTAHENELACAAKMRQLAK